jgi:hypothetical protein
MAIKLSTLQKAINKHENIYLIRKCHYPKSLIRIAKIDQCVVDGINRSIGNFAKEGQEWRTFSLTIVPDYILEKPDLAPEPRMDLQLTVSSYAGPKVNIRFSYSYFLINFLKYGALVDPYMKWTLLSAERFIEEEEKTRGFSKCFRGEKRFRPLLRKLGIAFCTYSILGEEQSLS